MSKMWDLQLKTSNYETRWRLLIFVLFFLLTSLLFANSQILYFSDSEIWGAVSTLWPHNRLEGSRPLFSLINSLTMNCFSHRMQGLLTLRAIYLCLALLSVHRLYLILKLFCEQKLALFLTLIAMSHPYFLSHIIKIRADNLTLFIFLVSAHFSAKLMRKERVTSRDLFLSSLYTFLLLSSSAKATYFFICELAIFLWIYKKTRHETLFKLIQCRAFSLFIITAIAMSSAPFRHSLKGAFEFFMSSFELGSNVDHRSPPYFSWISLQYVIKWMLLSPFYLLLGVVGLFRVTTENSSNKKDPIVLYFLGLSLACFMITLFHNHRVPFFIASYSFVFIISIGSAFQFQSLKSLVGFAAAILLFTQLFSGIYYSSRQWKLNNNTQQLQFYSRWKNLLDKDTSVKVLDPTSLLTPVSQRPLFLGPGMGDQTTELRDYVNQYSPQYIFHTVRLEWYAALLNSWEQNYSFHSKTGVWRKAYFIENNKNASHAETLAPLLFKLGLPKPIHPYAYLSLLDRKSPQKPVSHSFLNADHHLLQLNPKTPISMLWSLDSLVVPPYSRTQVTHRLEFEDQVGSFRELFNFDFMW